MMTEDKLKLLYIVEAMGGGVFTYLVNLANELADTYDIYIAYAVRPQTPTDYASYFDSRIHLIKVKNFVRTIHPIKDVKALFEIRSIAKTVRPDIIHLHSSKAGVLGRWGLDDRKIRMFYTPHGYAFLMRNHSAATRFFYKMIEKVSAKRFCTTIACGKEEYQESLKLGGYALHVDNGINVEEMRKMTDSITIERKSEKHTLTVFTLGRICNAKNPELFNQIALQLPDIHFVWIGGGELAHLLTAPNIEITGWMSRTDAVKKAISADIFILTSLWEGLPIALLEAMYMKKLCIVSEAVGNCDVIRDGKNGFVCGTAHEYIAAIRQKGTKLAEQLILQAYSDIEEKYNSVVMARKYRDIYNGKKSYRNHQTKLS